MDVYKITTTGRASCDGDHCESVAAALQRISDSLAVYAPIAVETDEGREWEAQVSDEDYTPGAPPLARIRRYEWVTACAWCGRVRNDAGSWVDGEILDDEIHMISHGICEDCFASASADSKRRTR